MSRSMMERDWCWLLMIDAYWYVVTISIYSFRVPILQTHLNRPLPMLLKAALMQCQILFLTSIKSHFLKTIQWIRPTCNTQPSITKSLPIGVVLHTTNWTQGWEKCFMHRRIKYKSMGMYSILTILILFVTWRTHSYWHFLQIYESRSESRPILPRPTFKRQS